MDIQTPANRLRDIVGADTSSPPFATGAAGLINPRTGAIGPYVDKAGRLIGGATGDRTKIISENFANHGTNDFVSVINPTGVVFANTTAMVHHMYTPGGYVYGLANIGVQTTIPVMAAAGLDIRGVETNAIGTEIFTHFAGASGRPFIVGADAPFFMRAGVTVADISGATVLIFGFRKAAVNNVTYTSYTDYVAIGVISSANPGAIVISSEAAGTPIAGNPIDTTDTWADAATKVIEVRVNSAGVASFLINGAAPTVTTALGVFAAGQAVIPFIHFIQHTDVAGAITLNSYDVGYL